MNRIVGVLGISMSIAPIIAGADPPAYSAPPEVRSWEWTVEDRIRARYDPEEIERRKQRAAESESHETLPTIPGFQVIDGRDNPELFFEWELFDALLSRGYAPKVEIREIFREQIEANLSAVDGFEMPEDFWRRMAATANDLLASRHAQQALAARLPDASASESAAILAEIDELQVGNCELRRLTSLAAEEEFGRQVLRRILYEGVAPDTFLSESTAAGRGEILRYVQEGCS